MPWSWTKEDPPRWDADKQRLFGAAELRAVGMRRPEPDAILADEWWRVADHTGAVVGYGWLDSEWGDARITFLVDPGARGTGIGAFVLGRLEHEAGRRGLNYIYNIVPKSHPDRTWMTHWLELHGFHESAHGDLRRQVHAAVPDD